MGLFGKKKAMIQQLQNTVTAQFTRLQKSTECIKAEWENIGKSKGPEPQPNLDNPGSMYPIFDSVEKYLQHTPWKKGRNSNSDYSNAIFLNWVSKKKKVPKTNADYPLYMAYELGIYDPIEKFAQMIQLQYILPASLSDSLRALKVSELKAILSKHGLPISGKKEDLINRIQNSGIDLKVLSLEPSFVLSQSGKMLVQQYQDYIELFRHKEWGITASRYKQEKQHMKNSSFYEVVLSIFHKQITKSTKEKNYGLSCCTWKDMESVYRKMGDYQTAAQCFVNHVYITLSGCENSGFISDFSDLCVFWDQIKLTGDNYKMYFSPDMVIKADNMCHLPFHFFSLKNSTMILSKLVQGEKVHLKDITHKKKKNYDWRV